MLSSIEEEFYPECPQGINDDEYKRWIDAEMCFNELYGKHKVSCEEAKFVLNVKIRYGYDIKRNDIFDCVEKPNPRVKIAFPIAIGPNTFATTMKFNTFYPAWDESFAFILPELPKPEDIEELKFFLIDGPDTIAESSYDTSVLKFGQPCSLKMNFGKHGCVTMIVEKQIRNQPDIRMSFELGEAEMQFRMRRIPRVMKSLRNYLGEEKGPKNLFETPIISLVGSGGGLRAMVGLLGMMEAFDETSLTDCLTYACGTSGSAWYLSSAYMREALLGKRQKQYHQWLKENFNIGFPWDFLNIAHLKRFVEESNQKKEERKPVSLVDFYGMSVSDAIIGKQYRCTHLTKMREYVQTAKVPYPIFATQQVINYIDSWQYHAGCYFSPFECEMPQYGINLDVELVNSEFYKGIVVRKLSEPKLSFLQGIFGSFFSMRLNRLLGINDYEDTDLYNRIDKVTKIKEKDSAENHVLKTVLQWLNNFPALLSRSFFIDRTGKILNFARGLGDLDKSPTNPFHSPPEGTKVQYEGLSSSADTLTLVDAGIVCNVPTEAALRPQRRSDILIVADFSMTDETVDQSTLIKAAKLAKEGGYKFPPIDFKKILQEPIKELYIFEDENDLDCPLVFWFMPSVIKFRQLKTYKSRNYKEVNRHLRPNEIFTDFRVFGSITYRTMNLKYGFLEFDRLRELMWFNVIINTEIMKRKIHERIVKKRKSQG